MTEEELDSIIEQTIAAQEATSMKDMGGDEFSTSDHSRACRSCTSFCQN